MTNSSLERLFQVVAAVLIGAAAVFLLYGYNDGAFVSVIVGCASFFLSIRYQAKTRVEQSDKDILEEKYGVKHSHHRPSYDDDLLQNKESNLASDSEKHNT